MFNLVLHTRSLKLLQPDFPMDTRAQRVSSTPSPKRYYDKFTWKPKSTAQADWIDQPRRLNNSTPAQSLNCIEVPTRWWSDCLEIKPRGQHRAVGAYRREFGADSQILVVFQCNKPNVWCGRVKDASLRQDETGRLPSCIQYYRHD